MNGGYFTPEVLYQAVDAVMNAGSRHKVEAVRRDYLLRQHPVGTQHLCDELCRCPVDGLVLLYQASADEHACQDIDCVFAHGMKHRTWMPMIARQGVRARYNQAILDARASQPLGRHPDVARQHVYVTALREIGLTLAAPVDDLGKVVRLDQKKVVCSCLDWGRLGWERIGRDGLRRDLGEGDEIDPYCPEHGA